MMSHATQHDTLPVPAPESLPAYSGIRNKPAAFPAGTFSPWSLSAVLAWLLVLAVLSVLTLHLGPWMGWLTTAVQMAIVAGVFMRLAWDARANWIFGVFGALLVAFRFVVVLADRSEYGPELDRYEHTPIDPNPPVSAE